MMAFVREVDRANTSSFGFLYLANVMGAMFGALATPVILVELCGFHHTLWIGGAMNAVIAVLSLALGTRYRQQTPEQSSELSAQSLSLSKLTLTDAVLFITGFTSLAMEVVWIRAFTPILGTQIYAFAFILLIYLAATLVGSSLYRNRTLLFGRNWSAAELIGLLAVFAFLPAVLNDPQMHPDSVFAVGTFELSTRVFPLLASLIPFCAALGFLTPQLIDERSKGSPCKAGNSYAVNILGCILGPLFASYLLLPRVGVKLSMVVLASP